MSAPYDPITIHLTPTDHVSTFGGEASLGDGLDMDQYGLHLGESYVVGLSSEQAVQLALELTNHLIANGHRFTVKPGDHQDQSQRLVYLTERTCTRNKKENRFHGRPNVIVGVPTCTPPTPPVTAVGAVLERVEPLPDTPATAATAPPARATHKIL